MKFRIIPESTNNIICRVLGFHVYFGSSFCSLLWLHDNGLNLAFVTLFCSCIMAGIFTVNI